MPIGKRRQNRFQVVQRASKFNNHRIRSTMDRNQIITLPRLHSSEAGWSQMEESFSSVPSLTVQQRIIFGSQ